MEAERFSQVAAWPLQFLELADSIMLGLGTDGRVLFINQKGADVLGYPVEQVVGRNWFETFVPGGARAQAHASFQRISAADGTTAGSHEGSILCRDGSERIIAWRDAVMRDPGGRVLAGLSAGEDITERRRAEAALRESEMRFRATFEQAAVGIAHLAPDGRFLRLNDRLCEITGYDRSELEGRTFGDLMHPEDRPAKVDRQAGDDRPEAPAAGDIPRYTVEQRYVRKDGSVAWANLTVSPVRDAQGAPDYLIAVVEDITRRKRAEHLLADADLQRMALSAAGAGAWFWDAETSRQSWSPEIYEIYGLPPEEAPLDLESWLGRCVHVDDRARFSHAVRRVAADGGGEFQIEYRCPHPTQGLRWVRSTGRVICNERHRPARAYGLSRDVTEQIRAEQALRESEERLRMAMAAGDISVWDWDIASGGISWADGRRWEENRSAMLTTIDAFHTSVHPADRQKVRLAIERALASRAEYNVEFRIVRPDGAVRWTAARGAVIRDHAGRPVRMIGIDQDIGTRKLAEERQSWLMAELDHRARSLLALVQSEVRKTPRPGGTGVPDGAATSGGADELPEMPAAPGRAAAEAVDATTVAEVVAHAVSAYPKERISVSGRLVTLAPKAAEALGVVLDELAANSAKWGALAGDEGLVAIEWSLLEEGEPLIDLSWTEDNRKPAAPAPNRPDLARRLLRSRIVAEFGGRVNLSFPAQGMRAALRMPLARVAAAVGA